MNAMPEAQTVPAHLIELKMAAATAKAAYYGWKNSPSDATIAMQVAQDIEEKRLLKAHCAADAAYAKAIAEHLAGVK